MLLPSTLLDFAAEGQVQVMERASGVVWTDEARAEVRRRIRDELERSIAFRPLTNCHGFGGSSVTRCRDAADPRVRPDVARRPLNAWA